MFFILEEVKETILDFLQRTVRVLWMCLIDLFILLWHDIIIKMTKHNSSSVKVSISKFNKSKSATKNEAEVTLKLLSNIIGNSESENNFYHKLLLTDRLVSKLYKAFANNLSANTKL